MLFLLVVPMSAATLLAAPFQSLPHESITSMVKSIIEYHAVSDDQTASQQPTPCPDCPMSDCDPDPAGDCSFHACCFLHPAMQVFRDLRHTPMATFSDHHLLAIFLPPPDDPPIS
ncbi:hypothetical protein FDK21_02625 [Cohaesibacter sp. CAU 1516]|uniref:hypothetical protein n=1 Tax=Cohaesibacter sp. CAU 1516 TaxID=2576038 RepID=UPI0010FD29C9|nr:hypothetical protein [Cohaesibacter sp. CAU 1516]TLP48574.1 hypothetical protein FDK21_02625 [Cohaesibacter sp. CAU 1516]